MLCLGTKIEGLDSETMTTTPEAAELSLQRMKMDERFA